MSYFHTSPQPMKHIFTPSSRFWCHDILHRSSRNTVEPASMDGAFAELLSSSWTHCRTTRSLRHRSICFKMYAGFMWFYDILCQWIWYGLACIKAHHFFVADSVLQRFQCVVMDYPHDEGLCIHAELNPQLWGLWSLPFLYSSADDFWTEEDPTSPDFHVIWWCGDAKCSDWEEVGTDSSPSWPRSIPRILGYHQASGWRCDAQCNFY